MTANLTIHRLLDEAFEGIPATPAARDLKEELRANLVARVEDLETSGMPAQEAARLAFSELGDVRELLDDAAAEDDALDPWTRHRVRPKAGFVVRTAVAAVLLAALVVGTVLAFVGVVDPFRLGADGGYLLMVLGAAVIGWIVADSLQQETSTHHPMPRGRAVGFGFGVGATVAAVPSILLGFLDDAPGAILVGGTLLVVGIALLAWLGATQTNRQKPWSLEQGRAWMKQAAARGEDAPSWAGGAGNRFERDPNAAARFGIYTMLIWVVGTVIAVLLGIFVGWGWSALAWVGAFVAMMLLLTQMLFKPGKAE